MPDISDLLRNWGAWSRLRPYYSHCFSIEHRYRSPQCWWPPGPRLNIDEQDALEVERVMRDVSRIHRVLLKLLYVYQLPVRIAGKRLSIPSRLVDNYKADAQTIVAALLEARKTVLTRQKKVSILVRYSELPNPRIHRESHVPVGT